MSRVLFITIHICCVVLVLNIILQSNYFQNQSPMKQTLVDYLVKLSAKQDNHVYSIK